MNIEDLSQRVVSFWLFFNTTCASKYYFRQRWCDLRVIFLRLLCGVNHFFPNNSTTQTGFVWCYLLSLILNHRHHTGHSGKILWNIMPFIEIDVYTRGLNHAKINRNSLRLAVDVLDTWTSMLILFISYRWLNWWRIDKTSCLL